MYTLLVLSGDTVIFRKEFVNQQDAEGKAYYWRQRTDSQGWPVYKVYLAEYLAPVPQQRSFNYA